MTADTRYILKFEECHEDCVALVGGKSTGLGSMIRAGVPVPPGFAVTTHAYRAMLGNGGLEREIAEILEGADSDDVDGLDAISDKIGAKIIERPIPPAVESAIREGYEELVALCSGPNGSDTPTDSLPVAVRSSATAEDLPGASFAGQQDTFLWVVGIDDVLTHVKRCWASLYTARAIAYRMERGFAHEKVYMSVCIQRWSTHARPVSCSRSTRSTVIDPRLPSMRAGDWGIGGIWRGHTGQLPCRQDRHEDRETHGVAQGNRVSGDSR